MKVLIIEDEVPAFRRLQKLLEEIEPSIEIVEVIDSVEMSVKWLRNHQAPELIFMDIQLADGLSFEIFSEIDLKIPIIFTTAYDEYTLKAFKVNSVDYLLKPINIEHLRQSLEKFKGLQSQFSNTSNLPDIEALKKIFLKEDPTFKSRFLVKFGDRLLPISCEDIAYFMTEDKIVLLITKEGKKYSIDYSLDELEALLNPLDFFRLNRQIVANIKSIAKIHQYFKGKLRVELLPHSDLEVIISRERSSPFKSWLDG